jgi:membrane protein required for colicin V production
MNMADAAILIFWLVCLIRGIFRGPVGEIFSIAGILGGLFTAALTFSAVSSVLPGWFGSWQWRDLTFFLLLFGSVYLLLTIAGIVAAYFLRLRRSGWISRVFGAGFGIAKGMLAIAVLLVPIVAFLPKQLTHLGGSILLPYENHLSEKLVQVVPAAVHDPFAAHIDRYKHSWRLKGAAANRQ